MKAIHKTLQRTVIAGAAALLTCSTWAQITFYEHDGFRGTHHQVQMASAPGNTVSVKRNGESRQ